MKRDYHITGDWIGVTGGVYGIASCGKAILVGTTTGIYLYDDKKDSLVLRRISSLRFN